MVELNKQAGTSRRRRIHSDEFEANAVASCMKPGMSMAAVPMAQGVNANLLRRWVRDAEMKSEATVVSASIAEGRKAQEAKTLFVPVSLPPPVQPAHVADIRIELQRGPTAVTVSWPASAASECAAWTRELLR
ncbi:transposase [Variovorax sp. H27-G14]|uniref:transposase n=1 Tax=Variovorax sp. H27-G14 TaxID=3111914 RepID=UPI0038FC172A